MDATRPVVAGWILEERLGSGGFGEVWKARRRHAELVRALKLIPVSSPSAFVGWRHEISRLEELSHPNIVRFYDADIVTDGGPYHDFAWIATELCERSLADELRRRNGHRITSAEGAELLEAMLGALAAAHGSGCVHRDVKPGNILLHRSGTWKLCDFGTARLIPPGESHPRTAVVGTFPYMSPAAHRGRQDQAADLYALGVTLHEALCGARLHPRANGMTDSEYVKLILDTPPVISPRLDVRWRGLVASLIGTQGEIGASELLAQLRRGGHVALAGADVEPSRPEARAVGRHQRGELGADETTEPGPENETITPRLHAEASGPTGLPPTLRRPPPPAPDRRTTRRTGGRGEREHVLGILALIVGSLIMAGVLLYQLFPNPAAVGAIVGVALVVVLLVVVAS